MDKLQTLLEALRADEFDARTDVQGAADLVMGVVAAAAGALAGVIEGSFGFGGLTAVSGVLVAGVAPAAEYARRTPDRGDEPILL